MTKTLECFNDGKYWLVLAFVSLVFISFGMMSHNVFADSLIGTITIGGYPQGIAVNSDTNKIYVGNTGNGIAVIDGATNNVVATINAGGNIVTINQNTNMIYSATGHTVYVINGSTNQVVKTIGVGFTTINDLKINPVTNKAYAVGYSYCSTNPCSFIDVINATSNTVSKEISVNSPTLEGVAIDPSTNKVYVSSGTIWVVDGMTDNVSSNIATSNADLMSIDSNTERLYASYDVSGTIAIVDLSTNNVLGTMSIGNEPIPITVNQETNKVYVGLAKYPDGNSLAVVNGSSNIVQQTLTVGNVPLGIAVNPNTNRIYVTNQQSGSVSVIDGSSSNTSTLPQNLQTNASNSQVTLSWTPPSSNGGSVITGYNVYRGTISGGESSTPIATGITSTTYSDTAVTNGQTYFYKVTAINSIGESAPSNEASATPTAPATVSIAPTGLTANTMSSSQINLSWTAPSNNGGSTITGYMIERSNNTGTTWSTVSSNTGSTSTTYSDTGLAPSTTYTYRVSAINTVGTSQPSNVSSATTNAITPPPPTGITLNNIKSTSGTVSASPYQITLANFNPGTGSNQLLVVGISADNNNAISVTFGGSQLTRKVSTFSNNDAEFWYLKNPSSTGNIVVTMSGSTSAVVGAYSFSGVNQTNPLPTSTTNYNSAAGSPTVSITTTNPNSWVLDLPSIYGSVTLGSPTCTQQWNTHMSGTVTGASSSKIIPTAGSVTCKWTASSGEMWDDVAVEVKAVGTGSGSTPTVPSSPSGLTSIASSSSQINLSWTAPSNNGGSAITGYKIERSTDSGSTWSSLVANTGSVSVQYSDTGLAPSTTYTYRVSAINSVGSSSPSNTTSATTNTITPPPPTGITLANVQSTSGSTSSSNPILLTGFNVGTGNNRLLVVGISADNSNAASVTFGGVPLTKKVSTFSNNDAEFWYLKNPTGTGTIAVTMSGSTSAVVGAYSFSGVNQTNPLPTSTTKHNTTPNSPNVTMTTKFAKDWVLDLPSIYGGITLGSPTCTQQWDTHMPGAITGASSSIIQTTPGSVTCKWTASSSEFWDDAAIEIAASK